MMDINDIIPNIQTTCARVYGCNVVLDRYDKQTGSIHICQIISNSPGYGNGTKCMEYLLNTFKRYGINHVSLVASPLGFFGDHEKKKRLPRLIKWYERFGFIKKSEVSWINLCAEMKLSFPRKSHHRTPAPTASKQNAEPLDFIPPPASMDRRNINKNPSEVCHSHEWINGGATVQEFGYTLVI